MRSMPGADEVRELVRRTFDAFGADQAEFHELAETILLEDGAYVARSYRADGLLAMWLIDAGIVQFYDADGKMLRTVNLFEELEPKRMAA